MKKSHLTVALLFAALAGGPIAACTSTSTRESTGEYIDDAAISSKVRGEIIADKDLDLFQIDVTTYKGVVQLSSFVNSEAIKTRTGQLAAGVEGVRSVQNNLIVK